MNGDVQNKWQKLQKDFLVRQLHFHFGPGSTSFLRVHKPEKYGDNMDDVRHTIAYANKEFKPVTGFETGRVYSGLRSVIPLFYETNEQKYHIGALEAGASFDQVLTILSEHLKIESAVLLKEKHVKANMWPEAIEQHFVESATNDCTCYLEASTTTQAKQVLQSALNDGVNFSKEGSDIISVEGHFYSLTRFPLRDFKADMDKRLPNVGSILLWRNVDQVVQSFESNKLIIYGYGVFGFLIVEILFFIGLRLTSGHLKDIIKGQVSDIKSKNNELNQAQRLAKLGSWQYNIVNDELTWSDEIYRIFEVNKDEFKPCYTYFLNAIHPDDKAMVDSAYQQSLTEQTPYFIVHRLLMKDGRVKYVEERGYSSYDEQGNAIYSHGTIADITVKYKLQSHQRLTQKVFEYSNEGIMVTKATGEIVNVNNAFCTITGYSKDDVIGQNPSILQSGKHTPAFYESLWSTLENKGSWQGEIWNRRKNGEEYAEWLTISAIPDSNGVIENYVALFTDITSKKHYEAQLIEIANHDALTGLLNRNTLNEQISTACAYSDRTGHMVAIMFIDLDGFKAINDEYGHEAGDAILVEVGFRLKQLCRQSDKCLRLGGDEFMLIYSEVKTHEDTKALATKIVSALKEPIIFESEKLVIGASVGIREYSSREHTRPEQLIKEADNAMYLAKSSGKNQFRIFEKLNAS